MITAIRWSWCACCRPAAAMRQVASAMETQGQFADMVGYKYLRKEGKR